MPELKSSSNFGDTTYTTTNSDIFSPDSAALNALSELASQLKDILTSDVTNQEKLLKMRAISYDEISKKDIDSQKKALKDRENAVKDLLEKEKQERLAMIDEEIKKYEEQHGNQIDDERKEQDKKWKKEKDRLEKIYKIKVKQEKSMSALNLKLTKEANRKKSRDAAVANTKELFGKGKTPAQRLKALKDLVPTTGKNGETLGKGGQALGLVDNLTHALGSALKQMDSQIEGIARKQSTIDTRLQGSKHNKTHGSYWGDISSSITAAAGVSPFVQQESIVSSVEKMVNMGIAFNVEQRATIDALKDKIAGTFNATNSTLLRLVRIQQQDTTAARLGMESALTSFLNNMYETTEYMGSIAEGIKGQLDEAMSMMSGENALSFEYQVQKWMGSMYSTGMNQSSVSTLAGVIGQIASGQLEGITNGGAGNLALMAANKAGLSVSSMMTNGLTDSDTNLLMQNMVDYLADIYDETKGNNVLQQQYAKIYGLNASDLKAISNLASSSSTVSKYGLTYKDAMNQLNNMANTMYQRTSIGEMMQNTLGNAMYSMAASIGSNPATYMTYKMANLLDDFTGGISIPDVLAMGTGVQLNTTVADLMRVGSLAGGVGTAIAKMVGSGGNGGLTGSGILNAMGVNNGLTTVSRGNGTGTTSFSGSSTSNSGSIRSNANTDDASNKVMTDQADENAKTVENVVESSDDVTLSNIHADISQLYDLLNNTVNSVLYNNAAIKVQVMNERLETNANITTSYSVGM